jgi:Carbohydrate esterase, sialic acid-specific acetylesterase
MTVETWTRTPTYTSIAGIGPYAITHPYTLGAIRAYVMVSGARVLLTEGAHYTLTPTKSDVNGNLFLTLATANTHAGRTLIIDRVTADEQGWVGLQGAQEKGLERQLDRHTQGIQEIRADVAGAIRTRNPLAVLDWAEGTIPILQGGRPVSGPTANEIANAQFYALRAELAAAGLGAFAIPNPFRIIVIGQSNIKGRSGENSTRWITASGFVFVWNPATLQWQDAVTMQGVEPFDTLGSNSPVIHKALDFAREHGVRVDLVFAVEGSTEMEKWTGGGYRNGVPIATDRTVSATNRVQFKKLTDAVAAANIPQFDALFFGQSEADLDTPDAVWRAELEFLIGDSKALGTNPDMNRRFHCVAFGPYSGPKSGQQTYRLASLQQFALENPDLAVFVPTQDLPGRDDEPGDPDFVINHYNDPAYTIIGRRAARALTGSLFGNSTIPDQRVEKLVIPGRGTQSDVLGHRMHEQDAITANHSILVRQDRYNGQLFRMGGTIQINLDGAANSVLGDGGMGFGFYTLNDTDQITFSCPARSCALLGSGSSGPSVTVTGAGVGSVTYMGSRYYVQFTPEADLITETGLIISTDVGATITRPTASVFHTGTLNGGRTLNLSATNASGQIYVARSGAGAFNLAVRDQTTSNLIGNLTQNQWLIAGWASGEWRRLAGGAL